MMPVQPAVEELHVALATGFPSHPLTHIRREENIYASSHRSEILNCEFADQSRRKLFVKYMTAVDEGHQDHGMRGGPAYEAVVYGELLAGVIRPAFHGVHQTRDGIRWLVIEFIEDAVPLQESADADAFLLAVQWLGRFHATLERRLTLGAPAGIRIYDREFYLGWARRTVEYAGDWHTYAPWLRPLCADFAEMVDVLLAAPRTLVHGEFYQHNILYREAGIFPHDWESAGLGAGELDLAQFSEDWPATEVDRFREAYRASRWPEGAPNRFELRLAAARVYGQLRWLGANPAWTEQPTEARWRLSELQRWAQCFTAEAARSSDEP